MDDSADNINDTKIELPLNAQSQIKNITAQNEEIVQKVP